MNKENFSNLLKENKISQTELSRISGYNRSTIFHWLSGTRKMSAAAEKHLRLIVRFREITGSFPE